MGNIFTQLYPPAPTFTGASVGDLSGKVYMITGGASGVGLELVKLLYPKNPTIYIAARHQQKAEEAIAAVKAAFPESKGEIHFLHLDLDDLTTIKQSADKFLEKETRLDVLWNNAGVMVPPAESKTKQGYELQLGTNCIAPFLLTKFLHPILRTTAATAPANSVRVVWTGSLAIEIDAAKGGMKLDDLHYEKGGSQEYKYAQSKAGNLFLGAELALRVKDEGIISVSQNPGQLKTALQRHVGRIRSWLYVSSSPQSIPLSIPPFPPHNSPKLQLSIALGGQDTFMLHPAILGGYTLLYSGLSEDITQEQNGRYIIPWGRLLTLRPDVQRGLTREEDGGAGTAKKFWDWCETEVEPYV
ncbi:MAG: hypothetical protein M1829_004447 [Trizodia sp. TS-e1964]|nr:MAG: hypothetical protein M1829_004447 [Trizodia sp. TS-e1964]